MLRAMFFTACITVGSALAPCAAEPPIADEARNPPLSASELVPAPSEPDPLTPRQEDFGPIRAPDVPDRNDAKTTAPKGEPLLTALRARLQSWPEQVGASERGDLAAIKAYYGADSSDLMWIAPSGLSNRGFAVSAALRRAHVWGLDATDFELPISPQRDQQADLVDAEIRLSFAVLKYARHAKGGRLDPSSLSKAIDMRLQLYEPLSVLEGLAAAAAPDAYLEALHPKHAGFVGLKAALAEVRSSATAVGTQGKVASANRTEMERRIIVNMERWRWLPEDLGEFHVWDNVPEQFTRVVHAGNVVLKERIVVGKPGSPTPMFSAPMRFVIFHPSWGVPEGIKTNELAPMLRRAQSSSSGWFFAENDGASRALRRHELRVFAGGREIDPDRVNWAAADVRQFSFQQPPSARNVLGVVKFRFPNKFDVYMHDTSERHLFSRANRTFSHGCMRVENPLKLAETVLAYDKGWGRDRIAQLVGRTSTTEVALEKSVPVHIVYFTATVDDAGNLHTHPDVYGMDNRVASALAGRAVVLASAPTEKTTKPETAAAKKPPRKSNQKPAKTARKPSNNDGFNPFGFLSAN